MDIKKAIGVNQRPAAVKINDDNCPKKGAMMLKDSKLIL